MKKKDSSTTCDVWSMEFISGEGEHSVWCGHGPGDQIRLVYCGCSIKTIWCT